MESLFWTLPLRGGGESLLDSPTPWWWRVSSGLSHSVVVKSLFWTLPLRGGVSPEAQDPLARSAPLPLPCRPSVGRLGPGPAQTEVFAGRLYLVIGASGRAGTTASMFGLSCSLTPALCRIAEDWFVGQGAGG